MHRYFVSYATTIGFGCGEVNLQQPIRSMSDISMVIEIIESQVDRSVAAVLSWRRFNGDDEHEI